MTSRLELGIVAVERNRRAEGHERARLIADGEAHHFRHFARERPLPPLRSLVREDVVLEHEIVGNGERNDRGVRALGLHRGVQEARFRRLHLAGVAPAAFDVEEQVVALQQLRDIRFRA